MARSMTFHNSWRMIDGGIPIWLNEAYGHYGSQQPTF